MTEIINGKNNELANPFCEHNYIELVECEKDYAKVKLEVRKESCNRIGIVHGGLLFTMGDTACGTAARSNGDRYITLSANFNYIGNTTIGHEITAEATVQHRGRSTCILDAIFKDDTGKLIAKGNYTFFKLNG